MRDVPAPIHCIQAKLALLIILLGLFSITAAQALDGKTLFKVSRGMELMDDDNLKNNSVEAFGDALFFHGYVSGVLDALNVSLPAGVELSQCSEIVANYLKSHPEDRHLPASFLVVCAVREKFPTK